MASTLAQDRINRNAYCSRSARHWYGSANSWVDPGEAAAIALVAPEVRDQPILDVALVEDVRYRFSRPSVVTIQLLTTHLNLLQFAGATILASA